MNIQNRRPIARVFCDKCGQRAMYVSDLTVRHCLSNDVWEYRFCCPTCFRIQLWPINPTRVADVAGLTSAANYSETAWLEEWELPEPERESGPPICMLDLIALVDELDGLPSASER